MPPTLLLDLDGTLVDTLPDLLASLNRSLRPAQPYTAAETRSWIGDGAGVLVKRALAARGKQATEADMQAMLQDYLAHVSDHSVPFPGCIAALDQLNAAGWKLAVCTNKPERAARDLLAALGLLDRFAAVGGGDSFPVRKPDPAHLHATLAAAGGHAERAVMVGDHQNDILAATGAGIPCVFAGWGYGDDPAGAVATAASFAELSELAGEVLTRGPA